MRQTPSPTQTPNKNPDSGGGLRLHTLNVHCMDSRFDQFVQFALRYTRNSSGDEIVNVNCLYDDIVHVLQNTIDSCINSATDRRGYVLERMCLPNAVK